MVNLIETRYKFEGSVLPSGIEFSGNVIIRDNKVYGTDGSVCCKLGSQLFSFTLFSVDYFNENGEGIWRELSFNLGSWPVELKVDSVLDEFKSFVLSSI